MEELFKHATESDYHGDLVTTVARNAGGRLVRIMERRAPEKGTSRDEVSLDAWSDQSGWVRVVDMDGYSGRSFASMSEAARKLAAAL